MLQIGRIFFSSGGGAIRTVGLLVLLATVLVTDRRDGIIPRRVTLATTIAALAIHALEAVGPAGAPARVASARLVAAALLGAALPCAARALSRRALGWGDARLCFALFLLTGAESGVIGLLIASVLALAGVAVEMAREKTLTVCEAGIPFGPFMVAGVTIAYAFGIEL